MMNTIAIILLLLLITTTETVSLSLPSQEQEFIKQPLGTPFKGQHVGVTHADLNNDGYEDILFAAGRHWIDQPFCLINLGPSNSSFTRFSPPLAIGDPGGYYQIDAVRLSNLDEAHWGVLLAGGTCHVTKPGYKGIQCDYGTNTAAVVYDVVVDGCSVDRPDVECDLSYKEIWRDPDPKGDRNGGFAPTLGNGIDPAIVLTGQGGITVYSPTSNENLFAEAFSHVNPRPPNQDPRSDIPRYAGFASGYIGAHQPGLIAGSRSDYELPPNPNAIILKSFEGFKVVSNTSLFGGESYLGNTSYALQTTGIAIEDLNGDGVQDLVESNFLYGNQIVSGYPLPQRVYFLDEFGMSNDRAITLMESDLGGRSVAVGQIFDASSLPDVAFGTSHGTVVLFANLGLRAVEKDDGTMTTKFLGFERRNTLDIGKAKCAIRDLKVVSLFPQRKDTCSVSIVCAVACGADKGEELSDNYVFHTNRACSSPPRISIMDKM